jgi:hypothetical protein
MKTLKALLSFGFILVIMLLSGCGQSSVAEKTPSSITNVSPTRTRKPILTATPSPISPQTAVPTLDEEQARARLLELLANNGECRLPCLWGIMPGLSSYQEARSILKPLTSISQSTHLNSASPNDISPIYADSDLTISTSIAYIYTTSGLVSSIAFRAGASQENKDGYISVFDSEIFGRRASAYMLPNILSEQGKPEAVLISTVGGYERGKNVPGFYLLLFYPDQGLFVSYTTSRQLAGGNVRGCFANAQVELRLYPPGQPDTFASNLAQTQWKNLWPVHVDSPNWKSIENASSMNLEQFYEIFRQRTDKCIETPANLWPILKS